jgi:hypothetical protein
VPKRAEIDAERSRSRWSYRLLLRHAMAGAIDSAGSRLALSLLE